MVSPLARTESSSSQCRHSGAIGRDFSRLVASAGLGCALDGTAELAVNCSFISDEQPGWSVITQDQADSRKMPLCFRSNF